MADLRAHAVNEAACEVAQDALRRMSGATAPQGVTSPKDLEAREEFAWVLSCVLAPVPTALGLGVLMPEVIRQQFPEDWAAYTLAHLGGWRRAFFGKPGAEFSPVEAQHA